MAEEITIERHQLLAEIASWYYLDGMSQQEIAERVNLSRPSISRLLIDAREMGIVEIKVNQPIPTVFELEQELERQFGLEEVRVLERRTSSNEDVIRMVGRLGVNVLDRVLQDDMIFGLAWGNTVHGVIEVLRPRRLPNVKVVQLIGGVGAPYRTIDAPEQCRRASRAFGAQHYYLNAPIRVESPEVAAALREDHSISEVLGLARQTNVALVGIGAMAPESSTQYHSGYISYEDLRRLEKLGAAGAICTSNFTVLGEPVEVPGYDDCMIGINREDLLSFDLTIGVAVSKRKATAILGAIRTGILDILITDDGVAEEVLTLAKCM